MDIREIFQDKIKIEPKVMSIESLFNNPERVRNTDFKPSYQRNYVWDDEKATYFIESILLGTEIPPLVYFRNSDKAEIIDGRQRYQTILRFKNNEFKLRKNGLYKLGNINIANKFFKDIDSELQDLFWDTKLRIIEFSFHSRKGINEEVEDLVKKEIFNRYNSGITPLKPTEIDNAVYYVDDLNSFLKKKLQDDQTLFHDVSELFHFEKNDIEIMLKKIRQLLVLHEIPIKYYSVKKQIIISKFYDALFSNIENSEINNIYSSLIRKLSLLKKIKSAFADNGASPYNRLISECLFWALSISENEKIDSKAIDNEVFIKELIKYLQENINAFQTQRSSFSKELYHRYCITAKFFEEKFKLNLNIYLDYNQIFKQKNEDVTPINEDRISFDDLRINKPEPSSIAIVDICRQMDRQRFLIRPPYQRNEVINKKKSSSIIESILLGIKLPPIFVFKREDTISEVLDGQQRLLSILGFIKRPYRDENNQNKYSDKNGFSLNLKNGILKEYHGKRFEQLPLEEQEKILNFDLWIIEIDFKNNRNFEPIDLFVRLNNKPYPIKDDTFEMWNSYISRDIIEMIKSAHNNQSSWFYFRKNNSRMEDENIYTALAYFQYCRNKDKKLIKENFTSTYFPKAIDIYKTGNKINFRIRLKNEITKVLEDINAKADFIDAINHLEFDFIRKLKELLTNRDSSAQKLNRNLDDIFMLGNGRRTQQGFYALWYFLFNIPSEKIKENKLEIRNDIKELFYDMSDIKDKETFISHVANFKNKYSIPEKDKIYDIAFLKEIGDIATGLKNSSSFKNELSENQIKYNYLKNDRFSNFMVSNVNSEEIYVNADSSLKAIFDSKVKILLAKNANHHTRLNLAFYDSKLAFSDNIIGIILNRPNILPKYILALLSSRFYFFKYFIKKGKCLNELKSISLADLGEVEIPILPIEEQKLFELIINFGANCEPKSQAALFYERIMDAMVYEMQFKSQFSTINVSIKKYVFDFPLINENQKREQAEILYSIISKPTYGLSGDLLKIINISEIKDIEFLY